MAKDPKNSKQFFKSFKAELKKVTWPTPKKIVADTSSVITIVIIIAVIVFVLDLAFDSMNKYGIDKIKEKTQSANISANNTNTSTDANIVVDNTVSTDNAAADNTADNQAANDANSVTNTEGGNP
ncbi:MAG: preprotein translocase subunit SecE [Firmicutes bacterium]|nr:preprotein translocase subunit SecE [Bacillota bacterium]